MTDMTQAHADWTRLEAASESVRLAVLSLARATYAHNLTRGCDPVSAYRVTSRDLPDAIHAAVEAALTTLQQETAAAQRQRVAYAAQGIDH